MECEYVVAKLLRFLGNLGKLAYFKNRRDQHNIPKQRKNSKNNNNIGKISKQKATFMMINALKTVPKRHFTRNGELNISKLNR